MANRNTRYLTATNAAITDTYVYDAFGNVITNTGTTANFYRYSGEQYDPNLGLIYLRARYLNPNAGRFMSRDPYAGNTFDPATLHRYSYVADDPTDKVDPSGRDYSIGISLTSIDIFSSLSSLPMLAAGGVVNAAQRAGAVLKFADISSTLGMVQRVLAAEVREPGQGSFDLNDSERGLYGVGAVIVNRVVSPKFPNTIEAVIKQRGQFAGFENYPTLPAYVNDIVTHLQGFANANGTKVLNYRLHMQNLLRVADRVVALDVNLDVFVPAGGPNIPTLYFRTEGSANPFGDGKGTKVPEYRDTAGGNDFYADRL